MSITTVAQRRGVCLPAAYANLLQIDTASRLLLARRASSTSSATSADSSLASPLFEPSDIDSVSDFSSDDDSCIDSVLEHWNNYPKDIDTPTTSSSLDSTLSVNSLTSHDSVSSIYSLYTSVDSVPSVYSIEGPQPVELEVLGASPSNFPLTDFTLEDLEPGDAIVLYPGLPPSQLDSRNYQPPKVQSKTDTTPLRRRGAVLRRRHDGNTSPDNFDLDSCRLLMHPDVVHVIESSFIAQSEEEWNPDPREWLHGGKDLLYASGEAARSRRRRFA